MSIHYEGRHFELECLMFATSGSRPGTISRIADELSELPDVDSFTVMHSTRA